MELQEIAVVLLTDLVTGKDNNILRIITIDKCKVLVDRVSGSLVPVAAVSLLIRGQYMNAAVQTVQIPRLAVANILVQYQRLILG